MLGGSSPPPEAYSPVTSDSLDQRLPAARADRVPRGILYMLGATVMFAVSSALAKWQVASYSFAEVLFYPRRRLARRLRRADPAAHRPARYSARGACAITSAAARRRRWRRA